MHNTGADWLSRTCSSCRHTQLQSHACTALSSLLDKSIWCTKHAHHWQSRFQRRGRRHSVRQVRQLRLPAHHKAAPLICARRSQLCVLGWKFDVAPETWSARYASCGFQPTTKPPASSAHRGKDMVLVHLSTWSAPRWQSAPEDTRPRSIRYASCAE